MEQLPHNQNNDIFRRGDEEALRHYLPGGGGVGMPIEQEFPPNESTLLDDDFFNTYGLDPDERV